MPDLQPGPPPGRPHPATRRLFFALWPDEAQSAALAHAIRKSVRACGGRPVPLPSLHVTLAFLGGVPESRIPELGAIARRAAEGFAPDPLPLALSFDSVAHWARPQILCALAREAVPGAQVPGPQSLAENLKRQAVAAGFSPDLKPFHAHVTVARKVVRAPAGHAMHSVQWHFGSFALVESRTDPRGAVYSVVEWYSLAGAEKVRTQESN